MKQISYVKGAGEPSLLRITVGDMFDETANNFPENDALIVYHQNIRWNYTQLQDEVNQCARALLAIGTLKGDRVGIWAPNCFQWTVLQFATAKIGAILVNINPAYRLHELKYALLQSECKVLVLAEKYKSSDYEQMILGLCPQLKYGDKEQLKCKAFKHLKYVIGLSEHPPKGLMPWKKFIKKSDEVPLSKVSQRQASLSYQDPINIQYTSGTTGFPKGATLSHFNILNNGYFVAENMNYTDKDKTIIPVPLYHCFGMVIGNLGCVTHGATMIYPSDGFDPEKVLEAVENEKATSLLGVPTMFIAELSLPEFKKYKLDSLRTGVMAGSPCPIEVMKSVQADMHMTEVQVAYGMTETSPVSTQTRMGTPLEKQVSTVGQVHPHLEIKIISPETGKTVPLNEPGELCTRGYSVMLGYWNDENQTHEAIDNENWMHSGDLATMDEEGYIKIVGRIKDMIIRGGENIYPREIEEFLFGHPKIREVQVIGVPDIKYGEEVMAWVILKENKEATEEELKEYCKGKIAHFKIPRYFKITDAFPLTVTGKVRKVEMREISIKELDLENAEKVKTA